MSYKLIVEMMSPIEASQILLTLPGLLASAPRGDGHTVIMMPGFCAGKHSMLLLRATLNKLGYNAIDWGQGVNFGPHRMMEDALCELVSRHSKSERVTLVGWSLGGLYARAIANLHPDSVRRVITMAAPINDRAASGQMKYLFNILSPTKIDDLDKTLLRYSQEEPSVPVLNFYSKNDGIVNWKDCLTLGPSSTNIEVRGSHMAMPHNTEVYQAILENLPQ